MQGSIRLLLVCPEPAICSLVKSIAEGEGHSFSCMASLGSALGLLQDGVLFDAMVVDAAGAAGVSASALASLVAYMTPGRIWLLAGLGTSHAGALDYGAGIHNVLRRPLQKHDIERVFQTVGEMPSNTCAIQAREPAETASRCAPIVEDLPAGGVFIANCPAMTDLYNTVRLLAPVDVPVLLLGESGVGKDVIAKLLHKHSVRAQQPYVSVNCAALPTELLESELFGYEAGAFTGALRAKPGMFEVADGGTLLLDEIGEMSPSMQAKLLHVLQDGQFSRLGGRTCTKANVRVVAATNINMESALSGNLFRSDLYYRISAFTISIPPLRQRREEIPMMVREMLSRHATRFGRSPVDVSPRLMTLIQEHDWPGNVRELSNFLVKMLILQDPNAIYEDLISHMRLHGKDRTPTPPADEAACVDDPDTMRSIVRNLKGKTESRLIQEALEATGWNRRQAAVHLQISYRALLYKIQQYRLCRYPAGLQLHKSP